MPTDCSIAALERNAETTVETCSKRLDRRDLTNDQRADTLKIRGRGYRRLSRPLDGAGDFETARQLTPADPEPYVWLGWTAFEQRNITDAQRYARKAIELGRGFARAHDLLGSVLSMTGAREQAFAAFNEAIRLDPANPYFRLNRLRMFKAYQRDSNVITEADGLLALPVDVIAQPDGSDYDERPTSFRTVAMLDKALALRRLGRVAEARALHDKVIELDPSPITYTWRAKFLGSQSTGTATDAAAELADIEKALAIDPDFWRAREERAYRHYLARDYNAASEDYLRALKAFPIDGELRWWYARNLRAMGKADEAIHEAITAFQSDPGFMMMKVTYLHTLGYVASVDQDKDPRPAFYDAARACMLDDKCR